MAEPRHVAGGRLDLTLISRPLQGISRWSLHPVLTSDHFATVTVLNIGSLPPPPPRPPRWSLKNANWARYARAVEAAFTDTVPPPTLDEYAEYVATTLQHAANLTFPHQRQPRTSHSWYYNERVQELNHRLSTARKAFCRWPSSLTRKYLTAAARHMVNANRRIRDEAWLEWCRSLGSNIALQETWTWTRSVSRPRPPPPPTQSDPAAEGDRLASHFATHTATESFPQSGRDLQARLAGFRRGATNAACFRHDAADHPFTAKEFQQALRHRREPAPGSDGLVYSLLAHAGPSGEGQPPRPLQPFLDRQPPPEPLEDSYHPPHTQAS